MWTSERSKEAGPLTQFAKCPAIEIECGPKNNPEIKQDLEDVLINVLENRINSREEILENINNQNFFRVTGKLEGVDTTKLNEFEEATVDNVTFYPLLIDSYKKGSTRKMETVDFYEIFNNR